jgi:uncharacterized protein (DUF362 family)
MFSQLKSRIHEVFIPTEPPVPSRVLSPTAEQRFEKLPHGASVCIKISAAYKLPYPFAISRGFIAQTADEIHAIRPDLSILLTEGGVGNVNITDNARELNLDTIPYTDFIDAERSEQLYVANPAEKPHSKEGFWLPSHWVNADMRVLLTTCKLRSHHFKRWFSGGTRNLIGLLPRKHYQLSTSRRAMRSEAHQNGMDAVVADLYLTTGKGLLTILDGRSVARQDEHLPLRFTRSLGSVIVENDPYDADMAMCKLLRLPFVPPYLARIAASETIRRGDRETGREGIRALGF